MKKQLLTLNVIGNTRLNASHYLIELSSDSPLPVMVPGQFVEVKIEGQPNTYLRRPFSVHRFDHAANSMHLLIKTVGDGTATLACLNKGDKLNVMLPLGKGFNLISRKKALLIGGGCGVAPLYFLAEQLSKKGNDITILIGGKTAKDILLQQEYRNFGLVEVSTEDGSEGEKGMVTGHSIFSTNKPDFDYIYCCGPDGMMRAVAHIAEKHGITCEVSLENTMACGIGACLCCVVETTRGNECVCTQGPVFDSRELKGWTKGVEVSCTLDENSR
ncbi:dihydroorotate dehydrogenase electron transfer subunit [Lentimicrobium sp.]